MRPVRLPSHALRYYTLVVFDIDILHLVTCHANVSEAAFSITDTSQIHIASIMDGLCFLGRSRAEIAQVNSMERNLNRVLP